MISLCAVDLGAESGRCFLGTFDGVRMECREVHRFPNGPVKILGSLYWDVLRLFGEIKEGLRRCAVEAGGELSGVAVDTWGVDFALLDRRGSLLENPYHYRDRRTEGMMEVAFRRVLREEIYFHTGIQFMPINTLYQLLSMVVAQAPILEVAATLLMMPNLFSFWLGGETVCEFTDATTTQCFNPRIGGWAFNLLERLGIPTHIWPAVVPPGTVVGILREEIQEEFGLGPIPVIATASHDTASAVAAVPAESERFAYISSGTWSLVGTEVSAPVITEQSLALNFTNEGGVGGRFRLLRNVMGLWLLQECRRLWTQRGDVLSYEDLMALAEATPPFGPLIDPDREEFLRPGDMPSQIQGFCARTGQIVPQGEGEVVRCILESLALKYRWVVEQLEHLLGYRLTPIHVVGGGARNRLLCQMTADATGKPVIAGPAEATAMGNLLVQAMALGHLNSLEEIREVVRASSDRAVYEPRPDGRWDEAYARFVPLLASHPEG